MSNLPTISLTEVQQMAGAVVASNLFGGIKTKEQAFTLMLICQAKGLHPIEAVERFHIIQGRPSLKAEAVLALFQEAGGKVTWDEYTDERVTGTFSHAKGGPLTVTWDIARAQKAGLANKDNWKNYTAAMLASRCATEAIRRVYPACLLGMHSVDEMQEVIEAEVVQPPKRTAKKVEAVDTNTGEVKVIEAATVDRAEQVRYAQELKLLSELPSHLQTDLVSRLREQHGVKKLTEITKPEAQYAVLADINEAVDLYRESLNVAE